jgi:hypothetical protein
LDDDKYPSLKIFFACCASATPCKARSPTASQRSVLFIVFISSAQWICHKPKLMKINNLR